MSAPRPDSPDFDFCDDGGRPKVVTYITTSKYRTGDTVQIVGAETEGRFMIQEVRSVGNYVLCSLSGETVKNGAEFAESQLTAA